MTKITLFSPDGTTEVFTECSFYEDFSPLVFIGNDWRGTRVKKTTTRLYDIEETAADADAKAQRVCDAMVSK